MKFSRLFLIASLLVIGGIAIFAINANPAGKNTNPEKQPEQIVNKPTIITTLFPFYDITTKLVADRAEVSLLLPPGVEPHSFEPTPQDILKIQEADIFIYTGDIMEPWVKDIVANLPASVTVIDASKGIDLIKSQDDHSHEDEHRHENDIKKDSQNNLDPHFWLDFNNTIIATNTISKAIASLNLIDNTILDTNTSRLNQDLDDLNSRYKSTLAKCQNRTILQAGHRTFEYLAKAYNLEYITTEELSPNSDTSAQDIAKLVQAVKKTKAKAIFSEELVEPRIAETIASETGVKILKLNGAHNISSEQFQSKTSFIDIMNQNLENLSISLDCK
jgi:zinc transport system substrate-binding protein